MSIGDMKAVDVRTVASGTLVDITGIVIDESLSKEERVTEFIKQNFGCTYCREAFQGCILLRVLDHFATGNREKLYEFVNGIFKRPRLSSQNPQSRNFQIQFRLTVRQDEGLPRVPHCRALFPHPVKNNENVEKYMEKYL